MTEDLRNPSLEDLRFLVGDCAVALSGASFLPDPSTVVRGTVEVRPVEEGRLLVIGQQASHLSPRARHG